MALPLRSISLFSAGILGAAGVATAAAASHGSDPRLLAAASAMCLAHAPALVAIVAAWNSLRTAPLSAGLLALGTAVFAGDLVSRHMAGHGLFPMSAPIGGGLMIVGWLALAVGALLQPKAG